MSKNISQALYYLINTFFAIIMTVTLYGVIKQEFLNPLILTNGVWMVFLLFATTLTISVTVPVVRFKAIKFIKAIWSYRTIVGPLVFTGLIVCQVLLIQRISAPIGWDVGRIFTANADILLEKDASQANLYLSMNPNNSFYFFMMHGVSRIADGMSKGLGSSWLFWQAVNTVFLDLGILCLVVAVKKLYHEKVAYLVGLLASFSLMLSPWIIVPYTDIFSFFIQALLLLLASYWLQVTKMGMKALLGALLGVVIVIGMLTKPTNLIVLIAALIVIMLKLVEQKSLRLSFNKINMLLVALVGLVVVTGNVSFQVFKQQQTIVTYDESKEKVWPLFIMMGLKEDGGYDSADSNYISSIPSRSEKFAEANRIIEERIEDFKPGSFSQFLLEKHFNNTDRGDFGWGKDGVNQTPETPAKSNFQIKLRDTYYQKGTRSNNLRFYMQWLWVVTLIGVGITAFRMNDRVVTLILKLAILGAFMYLLIFEGGRSRYLIQFLPLFYTLSGIGWDTLFRKGIE